MTKLYTSNQYEVRKGEAETCETGKKQLVTCLEIIIIIIIIIIAFVKRHLSSKLFRGAGGISMVKMEDSSTQVSTKHEFPRAQISLKL